MSDLTAWWNSIRDVIGDVPDARQWAMIKSRLDDELEDPNEMAQRYMHAAFASGRLNQEQAETAREAQDSMPLREAYYKAQAEFFGRRADDILWNQKIVEDNAPRAVEGELLTDDRGKPTEWQKRKLKTLKGG